MWEPRRLTTLWASTACYRDSFIFTAYSDTQVTSFDSDKRLVDIGQREWRRTQQSAEGEASITVIPTTYTISIHGLCIAKLLSASQKVLLRRVKPPNISTLC
jgi:hypothetical protein